MEELLNKLIEKGWKPFGRTPKKHGGIYCMKTDMFEFGIKFYVDDLEGIWEFIAYEMPIRSVVSKSSGLWQFVCKNGMIKHEVYEDIQSWEHTTAEHSDFWYTSGDNYEYRIIQSALCNEDKLEQFLLDNIKV